tara:strand:+ start:91 stop:621 length:531 start_codon:yes stop_codon:yes gene_type:complete
MNWFNILKVLGTKSGYAQLDFDNIIEEEDDNCKKRWKELGAKLLNANIQGIGLEREVQENGEDVIYYVDYELAKESKQYVLAGVGFDDSVPEEVYCKALEMLEAAQMKEGKETEYIGEYEVISFNTLIAEGGLFGVGIHEASDEKAIVMVYYKNQPPLRENIILEATFKALRRALQ